MKKSKYNHIRNIQGQSVLFNVMSEKICIMDPVISNIYCSTDADHILNKHPEFYRYLYDNTSLVDDDIDEASQLESMWEEHDNAETSFSLIVNPTLNCNMSCWYCYEQHAGNMNITEDVVSSIKLLISSKLESASLASFHLGFFGGEPLLKFNSVCKPLMDYVCSLGANRDKILSFSFVTNGYLLSDEIVNYIKSINIPISFQITLDGNRENHDTVRRTRSGKPSYDAILYNCKKLIRCKNVYVTLRCNYTQKNIVYFTDTIADMQRVFDCDISTISNLKIDFHRVWQDLKNSINSSAEFNSIEDFVKEQYTKAGFSLSPDKDINRYRCYADRMNHALVNYDGNVFRCTARDFNIENAEGKLLANGQIIWNEKSDKRNKLKWTNTTCKSCDIYPICSGNCSQSKLDMSHITGCYKNYTQAQKEDIITRRLNLLIRQAKLRVNKQLNPNNLK